MGKWVELRYKPSRDIPKFAREYHTLSPSKLVDIILAKRNKEVSPQSISMFFKRNPKVLEKLQAEIIAKELPELEVSPTIFNNGTFEHLPSVKEWIIQLDARELAPAYVSGKLSLLKRVCRGELLGFNLTEETNPDGSPIWVLKHPDRLTLKECMKLISILKQKGKDTYYIKRDLKDFMQSKGVGVGKRIAVGKPKGYGKYAKLHAEKSILRDMLEWIKTINFEAYVEDEFMYKTGTRITATENALIENIGEVGDTGVITVYDKGRKSKYPKGHPWDKRLDSILLHDLKQIIGDRKSGKIFNVNRDELLALNRQALEKFAPEILERYPQLFVNHFWRHMFFQHILRECDWNSDIAGELGGASAQSVRESYGKPPEEIIRKWGDKYNITI